MIDSMFTSSNNLLYLYVYPRDDDNKHQQLIIEVRQGRRHFNDDETFLAVDIAM